mmetsp:Transcript_7263/g.17085  ORF Transcript_7263/g.17085 Transcript_7263/m.17085 type:complete len:283 (+) Transcript_7263:109-957(+)
MVTTQSGCQHNAFLVNLLTVGVIVGYNSVFQSTNCQSNSLWFSNHRCARLDSIHSQVQNCEGSHGSKFRGQFTFLDSCNSGIQFIGNTLDSLGTAISDNRRVKLVSSPDYNIDVNRIVHTDYAIHPTGIGRRNGLHGFGSSLDDEFVDSQVALLSNSTRQSGSKLEDFVHGNIDSQIVMRNIAFGLCQSHGGFLGGSGDGVICVSNSWNGSGGGHGCLGRCSFGRHGSSDSGRIEFSDIICNNAAIGSSSSNGRNIVSHIFGQHVCQRRGYDTTTRRCGSGC